MSNKSGTGQVGAALKVHKNQVLKYAKILYCDNDIKFAAPETTRMTTHKTQKPLFSNWKHQKTDLFRNLFYSKKNRKNVSECLKTILTLPKNSSLRSNSFIKKKVVPFD